MGSREMTQDNVFNLLWMDIYATSCAMIRGNIVTS